MSFKERYGITGGSLALVSVIVILTLSVFANTLGNGFVFDDKGQIVDNYWIHEIKYLPSILSSHSLAFIGDDQPAITYRPLVFVVYMIEYALFGLEPWGWHLVNILLHALNSVMVFLTVSYLFRGKNDGPSGAVNGLPAFAAAALFAVHPMNSEVAAWVGCVPELVYTFLGLSAFNLYALYRDRSCSFALFFSVLLYFIGLFAKETSLVLPGILFAYDYARDRDEPLFTGARIKRYLPYVLAAFLYIVIRVLSMGGHMVPTVKLHAYLTGPQFILNVFPILFDYMKALVLPVNIYPLQLFKPVFSITEPRAFLTLTLALGVAGALFAFRRKMNPLYLVSAAMIIFPLLPVLYVPALSRHSFADRYLYFPSIGFVIIFGLFLNEALKNQKAVRITAVLALAALICAYSVGAFGRNLNWKDDASLWDAALKGSDNNYIAIHSVGLMDLRKGNTDAAVSGLERALKLNKESLHPDATALVLTGKVLAVAYGQKGRVDDAVREYRDVLSIDRNDPISNYNLALIYQDKGLLDEAVELYQRALLFTKKPKQRKDIYNNLGVCYQRKGFFSEAAANYEEALKLSPGDPVITRNISSISGIGR